MPKSGSTLLSWLQKDILIHSIPENGQIKFEQAILDKYINGIGHFVNNVGNQETIEKLIDLSEEHGSFVVKCHSEMTKHIEEAITNKKVIATYIYRDPRDIILSVLDHGKRKKSNNKSNPFFAQFKTIDQTIPFVINQCSMALEWINSDLVETFMYHNLLINPQKEISRFCLAIDQIIDKKKIEKAVNTYTNNQSTGVRQFNTGKLLRYKEEMTSKDIELCNYYLSDYIQQLGYDL